MIRLLSWALARRLRRIRGRRWTFVDVRFCQPMGDPEGWVVETRNGIHETTTWAAGSSLIAVLRDAEKRVREQDPVRRWDRT